MCLRECGGIEAVQPTPAVHPAPWSWYRILFYTGLLVMLGFWVAASFGARLAVSLSGVYNFECTNQPPPLTAPPGCGWLAAQIGHAVTLAVLGGVGGLGGLVAVIIGRRGSRGLDARMARKLRF